MNKSRPPHAHAEQGAPVQRTRPAPPMQPPACTAPHAVGPVLRAQQDGRLGSCSALLAVQHWTGSVAMAGAFWLAERVPKQPTLSSRIQPDAADVLLGAGGHFMNGPIYVCDAQPGDVLQARPPGHQMPGVLHVGLHAAAMFRSRLWAGHAGWPVAHLPCSLLQPAQCTRCSTFWVLPRGRRVSPLPARQQKWLSLYIMAGTARDGVVWQPAGGDPGSAALPDHVGS